MKPEFNVEQIIIHECYKYGHIWEVKSIVNGFGKVEYVSVCRICGKIGDRK